MESGSGNSSPMRGSDSESGKVGRIGDGGTPIFVNQASAAAFRAQRPGWSVSVERFQKRGEKPKLKRMRMLAKANSERHRAGRLSEG